MNIARTCLQRRIARLFCVTAGVLLLAAGPLGAQDVGPSPFLPEGFGAAPQQAQPQQASPLDRLELRGVMVIEGRTTAVVFDSSTNRSSTIEVGSQENGIKVSDYKAQDDSVLVESGGVQKRIHLREAKIVAVAAAAIPPPPVPGTPQPPPAVAAAGATAPVSPQMSDEEVRQRMQRVAEEIRRRREMRRQMTNAAQQQPGAPGTN